MSISYEAPHCATSSILMLNSPSCFKIFFLGPCSQTSSILFLPLMWETRFYTTIQNDWQNFFLTFTFLDSRREDKRRWTDGNKSGENVSHTARFIDFKLFAVGPNGWTIAKRCFCLLELCHPATYAHVFFHTYGKQSKTCSLFIHRKHFQCQRRL
jgi:hypothetical protein